MLTCTGRVCLTAAGIGMGLFLSGLSLQSAKAAAFLGPRFGPPVSWPLQEERVVVAIDTQLALTRATFVFAPEVRRREEAQFTCHLPPEAFVLEFAYWFQGQRIPAEVREKTWARGVYQRIVSARRDPAWGERVDATTFQARIFPVEPGREMKIEIAYAQLLPATGRTVKYTYSRGKIHRGRFSFTARLTDSRGLEEVRCSESSARLQRKGQEVVVSLEQALREPAGDLQVAYCFPPNAPAATLLTAQDRKWGYFALLFTAPRKVADLTVAGAIPQWLFPSRRRVVKAGESLCFVGREFQRPPVVVALTSQGATTCSVKTKAPRALWRELLPRLWAWRYVQHLQSQPHPDEIRALILYLSHTYGVESKYTAFLAVPPEELRAVWGWERLPAQSKKPAHSFLLSWQGRLAKLPSPRTFVDVPFSHWAYEAWVSLAEAGILTGYPDGRVRLKAKLTRYELAALLRRLGEHFGLEWLPSPSAEPTFPDVPPTHWAAPAVQMATAFGLLTGYPDGTFRGAQPVIRYEFVVALARWIKGFAPHLTVASRGAPIYADVPSEHWASSSLTTLAEMGLIEGYPDGSFAGHEPTTRVEAIMALSRLLDLGARLRAQRRLPQVQGEREPSVIVETGRQVRSVTVTLNSQPLALERRNWGYKSLWQGKVAGGVPFPASELTVQVEGEKGHRAKYTVRFATEPSLWEGVGEAAGKVTAFRVQAVPPPAMLLTVNGKGDIAELVRRWRDEPWQGFLPRRAGTGGKQEFLLVLLYPQEQPIRLWWTVRSTADG